MLLVLSHQYLRYINQNLTDFKTDLQRSGLTKGEQKA